MTRLTKQELLSYLHEIIDCNAFELNTSDSSSNQSKIYIPYMMNDALECYLLLNNAAITGTYLETSKEPLQVEAADGAQTMALIFRQGTDNVFTIWYQEAYRVLNCYRYEQIGHFWVKGQEPWRRLVYIIGTIHDKFNYLGIEVCNEAELSLIPLMEFAPFRHYSPIHDSLDAYYHESPEGLACMKQLAFEAEDHTFLFLLKLYEKMPCKKIFAKFLTHQMLLPSRIRLYETIHEKVRIGSMAYPERRYPQQINQDINAQRIHITETLKAYGFSGNYPLFHKDNLQIFAVEEHPFTILESEQYQFKIQYMVSEIGTLAFHTPHPLNAGFFNERGYFGRIEKDLSFINR